MTRIQIISPFEGYLDVAEGTKFPITKSVSEIKDLSKRKSDITKTCVLSGTDNNNTLLGNFFNVNIVANQFNPNVKVLCNVIQDDVLVMENAYLQLLSINRSSKSSGTADQEIEYEVVLSSSRANLMQLVKQKEVQDIDFSEFNHVYNRANVIATSGNTWVDGYKYHRAFKGDTNGVYLKDFKAGMFFKTVFDKIHESNGFQYEFDEMSATTFEQLFIPYNGPQPKMSRVDVDLYSVRSSLSGSPVTVLNSSNLNGNINGQTMYQYPLATDNEIQDNSDSYNPATARYTSKIVARYNATVDINYDVILSSSTNAYMRANGTYNPNIPVGIKHNTNIEFYKNGNIGAGISTAVASAQAPEIFYTVNDGPVLAGVPKTIGSFNGTANIVLNPNQPLNINDYLALHLKTNVRPGSGTANAVTFFTTSGGTTQATVEYSVRINSINITISPVAEELNLGQTVVMNEFLPKKLKQIDILNTFLKLYNIYSIDNPDDPDTIIYKTRDKFYDDGDEQDWTDIFAVDRQHTIKLLSETQNKKLILKYKDDSKDPSTSNYKLATNESFGQLEFTFDNEFVLDEQIIEIPPATTAMVQDGHGDVVPSFLMSNPDCEWRLLLDNDWIPCQGSGWDFIETTPLEKWHYNMYPSLHFWNDPYFPTQSIQFGTSDYYFYNNYTLTNNNIFNQYWRRTINNWNVGKVMEAWFEITPSLFNKTKLNDRIFIKDAWWNIVEIKDYDANADNALTKVVLISVDDDIRFKNFNSRVPFVFNPTDPIIGNPIKEIMDKEILNNNVFVVGSFGSTVSGVNNVVNGKYNSVYGDGNIVTSQKSTIIGDNNVIGVDRVLVMDDNITATTENTAFIKNVEVSNSLTIKSGSTFDLTGVIITGFENPGFIVQDTKANIETLRNSGQLLLGVTYYLTDKGIFLIALNNSNLSSTGWRLQTILTNTAYVPSGSVKGVWRSTLSVSQNDIVVWGGKTWRNRTGDIGLSIDDTALDGTNWLIISSYNVNKIFNIVYDWDNDYIVKQIDDNGNEYSCPIGISTLLGFNPVDISDWGNDKIFSNKCYGVFNNYNTNNIYNNTNRGRISNNIIDEIYDNSNIGDIFGNTSSSTSIYFNSNLGDINSNNNIGGNIYFNTNLGDISSNSCASGSISIYSNSNKSHINSNITALGNNLNIYNNYNNGYITRNSVSSIFALTVNIHSNVNNGNIGNTASDTSRTVDITDSITNK